MIRSSVALLVLSSPVPVSDPALGPVVSVLTVSVMTVVSLRKVSTVDTVNSESALLSFSAFSRLLI